MVLASGAPSAAQTPAPVGGSWSETEKWPDFTIGAWGEGDGPASGIIAYYFGGGGAPPAAAPPTGAPPAGAAAPARPRGCSAAFCSAAEAPLTPEFRKTVKVSPENARNVYNTTQWSCEPGGVILEPGQRFYYSKGLIVLGGLADYYNSWRRIYMDGSPHPEYVEPTYFGHSIGRWEGDTLVVDTVGISAEAKIAYGLELGSDKTHLVERFRMTDPTTMEIRRVITNPDVFTRPVESTITRKLSVGYEFPETYCWSDRQEAGTEIDLSVR